MKTMVGHFAVFNSWAKIDSMYEGTFMERIAPGAFVRSFKENRANIRVTLNHGSDPMAGDKPLGPITELREDGTGAYYEVPLIDTSYTRDILAGLEAGLYGASFRFQVIQEEFETRAARSDHNPEGLPERTILEAAVSEFGPVTYPAYAGASAGVRAVPNPARPAPEPLPGAIKIDTWTLRQLQNLDPDGREIGGWVTGPGDSGATPLITGLYLASDPDESDSETTVFDRAKRDLLLEQLPLDMRVVGDFHTHGSTDSVEPSEPDLKSWVGLAKRWKRAWIGLIAADRHDDSPHARYLGTDLAAYVVHPDGVYRRVQIHEMET